LMRALVRRAGHVFRVTERTNDRATVQIIRNDLPAGVQPYVTTFTADEARAAKLLGKRNWEQYRPAMLVARATSTAVREECPELLFGIAYTPEELGAVTDEHGQVIEGEEAPDHAVHSSWSDLRQRRAEEPADYVMSPGAFMTVEPIPTDDERAVIARLISEVALNWGTNLLDWWHKRVADRVHLADRSTGWRVVDDLEQPITLRQVFADQLWRSAEQYAVTKEDVRKLWAAAVEARCLDYSVIMTSAVDDEITGHDKLGTLLTEHAKTLPHATETGVESGE
jgi:hypothetical protein